MIKRLVVSSVLLVLLLSSCNFPHSKTIENPTSTLSESMDATKIASLEPLTSPGVQIQSPADGAQFPENTPLVIQFNSYGGPYLEADLLVDNTPADSIVLDQTVMNPGGTLTWKTPVGGNHSIVVELLTPDKQFFTASIQVNVAGAVETTTPLEESAPTIDPMRDSVVAQLIKIMQDTYQIDMTSPAIIRKYRDGVPNDPWVSVAYVGNWMFDVEITPDQVLLMPHPVNSISDGSVAIPAGEKLTQVCRPSGTLKILAVLLDFQNLGLTKDEALGSLSTVKDQINSEFANLSVAGGAGSPILQLQLDGLYISPVPALDNHLLTPAIIKSSTGVDTSGYDLIVQVDFDGNDTYRKILAARNFDTNGFTQGSCLDKNVSIWISLNTKEQALNQDRDKRLIRTLTHELQHTFGLPFSHSWPCGDGSQPDSADQCDLYNWPTLVLGWTDTDGDGIPEILDLTPYGISNP